MFTKSLVAAAFVAGAVALGSAGAAHADPHVHFGFGFDGWDGGYPHEPPPPGYGDGGYPDEPPPPGYWGHRHRHHFHGWGGPEPVMSYGVSCADGRNIVAGSGFHGVAAFDCSAPVYGYTGWKHGDQFRVSVNFRGNIVDVTPIY